MQRVKPNIEHPCYEFAYVTQLNKDQYLELIVSAQFAVMSD